MRVKVYRNLHIKDGAKYSVSYRGLVITHAALISLRAVRMKQPLARQLQAVREGHRSVVCWLSGDWDVEMSRLSPVGSYRRLACDPRKVDCFCDAFSGERVDSAVSVVLTPTGVLFSQVEPAAGLRSADWSSVWMGLLENGVL
jgi:hypothetical protein